MICPDCQTENLPGADVCESCGNDLRSLDIPTGDDAFSSHVLNDHLGEIGVEQTREVAPGDPVALAIRVMQQHKTECVLVEEGSKVVGILTERDILLKAAGAKEDLNAVAVRQIMTPDPVILRDEDTIAVALHKMSIGGFRHIPLVTDGRPPRVVSIRALFSHISPYITGELTRS